MGFLRWLLADDWEKRRKHDLGPYYQDQLDEIRRLYPREADEIILKEHRRLGFFFSGALNSEVRRISRRRERQGAAPILVEAQKASPEFRISRSDHNAAMRTGEYDCGRFALAAVLGLGLPDVQRLIPEFRKELTYTQMQIGLDRAGRRWRDNGTERPSLGHYGLVGIVYDKKERNGHWVAAWNGGNGVKVFDNYSLRWMDGAKWDSEIKPRVTAGADYEIEGVIEVSA